MVTITVTTKEYYDDRGRMTFSQDERNIITKNTYDPATGLMIKNQVDVDAGPGGGSGGWWFSARLFRGRHGDLRCRLPDQ